MQSPEMETDGFAPQDAGQSFVCPCGALDEKKGE